jgi:dystonin
MMAWNRQKRLHDHLLMLKEKEKVKHFDWEDWRKRFLKFHNYKRSKVVDFLTKMDKKQIGLIPKEIFIEEFIKQSKIISFL